MAFTPKSFAQIFSSMMTSVLANTPISDINPGSVISTLLEVAAQEDYQQYFQMVESIKGYNLDTIEGTDLDTKASEYGLSRNAAQKATGTVTITDSSITKISTKIYAGLPGPVSGQNYIYVDDGSSFTGTGSVVIGRNSNNTETIAYTSITNYTNYYKINLSAGLTNDHGTDETVILSQGGNRTVSAGTIVKVSESDLSDEVLFFTDVDLTIYDGEESDSVNVTAKEAGDLGNVPTGSINAFDTEPFSNATVANAAALTNGTDEETDQELRDRIKDHIQTLSRGTKSAIINAITGLVDATTSKRIVSAKLIEATLGDTLSKLYIDDGTGFEPSYTGQNYETVLEEASGGETLLQLDFFPLTKAQVTTANAEPYAITNGMTLIYTVGGVQETTTFITADFATTAAATAEEVVRAINARASLIEARTSASKTEVVIRAVENTNEEIQVDGSSTANTALGFPTNEVNTLHLYKYDIDSIDLLSKDGKTASLECSSTSTYDFTGAPHDLNIIIDGKSANTQTVTFQVADFVVLAAGTAEEVVTRINAELSGAVASVSSGITKVTITSNLENSSSSSIEIPVGAPGTANAILNFSTTAVTGEDKDYTLNRFNGQIELESELTAGDKIEAATSLTRGFTVGANSEPFALTNADTIDVKVDAGGAQTATFNTGDFADITQATAAEVVTVINTDVKGSTAYETSDGRVGIRTNSFDEADSIEVDAVTGTATALGFSVGTVVTGLKPHMGYLESTNAENYDFVNGHQLIVVMDDDSVNNTFIIDMDLDGDVTAVDGGSPTTKFTGQITNVSQNFNTKFTSDTDLVDFRCIWLTGTNITTGTIFEFANTVGDTWRITFDALPAGFTAAGYPAGSMIVVANAANSDNNGTFLITASNDGGNGYVEVTNALGIAEGPGSAATCTLHQGRTITAYDSATGEFTLGVALINSIATGQTFIILPRTAANVCTYLNNNINSTFSVKGIAEATNNGTNVQLSSLTVGESGAVAVSDTDGNDIIGFDITTTYYGVDAYQRYTGLLEKTQKTVDGVDTDFRTYSGYRAAGTQIEVTSPVIYSAEVSADISLDDGVTLSQISDEVENEISKYINNLGVGEDVIVSELINVIMDVYGVADVEITTPSANISISDNEICRIVDESIIVS